MRYFVFMGGIFFFCCLAGKLDAQTEVHSTEKDRRVVERYLSAFQERKDLPIGELVTQTALSFLDKPYVSSTLEQEPECLTVNLREFDCTTFVENVLALAYTLQERSPSFGDYCRQLQGFRYRNDTIDDYTDRLHYFTDWIYENQRKKLLEDVTRQIGGKPLALQLSFMSGHPQFYKQLKNNEAFLRMLKAKELEINHRRYFYIPVSDIPACEPAMQSGDIVCFVTTIVGLDVSHVGFIYKKEGKTTFIHASSAVHKVIVQPDSLADYISHSPKCKGVLIIRPLGRK